MAFYTAESDSTLQDNFIVKDADVYIMKVEAEGTGVESEASNDITLTPATSPAWSSNAYQSTVGKNLVVTADSSGLFFGPVKSNSTTALVFDATTMTDVSDGTAGAATDWGVGTTYSFRIYTADSTYAWGAYFGHCRDISVAFTEDRLEFEKGIPKESIVEDLLKFQVDVNGTNFTPNKDVFRAVLNGVSYGSQTSQNETHFGFAPAVRSYYMVTLIGQNRSGKEMMWQFFKGQFRINGELNLSAEEYKGLAWTLAVKKDNLRGDARNAFRLVIDE